MGHMGGKMRHKWVHDLYDRDHCSRCNIMKRKSTAKMKMKNGIYKTVEISTDDGKTWRWLKDKDPMPKCHEKITGDSRWQAFW